MRVILLHVQTLEDDEDEDSFLEEDEEEDETEVEEDEEPSMEDGRLRRR